jgi:hypothetical protein
MAISTKMRALPQWAKRLLFAVMGIAMLGLLTGLTIATLMLVVTEGLQQTKSSLLLHQREQHAVTALDRCHLIVIATRLPCFS